MRTIGKERSAIGFGDNNHTNEEGGMCRSYYNVRRAFRTVTLGILSFSLPLLLANHAFAQACPGSQIGNCSSACPVLGLAANPLVTTNGGTVVFTVSVQNNCFDGCDLSNVFVEGFCPGPGGGPTPPSILLASGLCLIRGTAAINVGIFSCVINVGAANAATATAHSVGTLLSYPPTFPSEDTRPFPVRVIHPN